MPYRFQVTSQGLRISAPYKGIPVISAVTHCRKITTVLLPTFKTSLTFWFPWSSCKSRRALSSFDFSSNAWVAYNQI